MPLFLRRAAAANPPFLPRLIISGSGIGGIDADPLAVTAEFLIGHDSVHLGIQRVITPQTDIVARMYFGPQLPDNNAAGPNDLTAKDLYATPLASAVATVS
jgi:hypothetical protein